MMRLLMILRVALKALNRNKMRTALTMLGMIIGVAAVIAMVALGKGAQSSIEDQIKSAGTNIINVMSGNFMSMGVRQGSGASNTLTVEDAMAIRSSVPGAQYVAPSVNTRNQIIAGNQNWQTRIQGTDVEFPPIRSWPLKYGTFFSTQDVTSATKVVVLGTVVVDEPLRRGRRSDGPDRPDQEPALQGHRRDGQQGVRARGSRTRTTRRWCPTRRRRRS